MFPGCTSSTICSSALAAAQGAILFTNSVPKLCCWPLTGLIIATTLAPILLSYGSTPRVRHPPVRPPLTSALSVSARLLITLCEGVGTLLSSIIPECKEVAKEDGIGRNEDDETISRMS
jgi:hypothetical protein